MIFARSLNCRFADKAFSSAWALPSFSFLLSFLLASCSQSHCFHSNSVAVPIQIYFKLCLLSLVTLTDFPGFFCNRQVEMMRALFYRQSYVSRLALPLSSRCVCKMTVSSFIYLLRWRLPSIWLFPRCHVRTYHAQTLSLDLCHFHGILSSYFLLIPCASISVCLCALHTHVIAVTVRFILLSSLFERTADNTRVPS